VRPVPATPRQTKTGLRRQRRYVSCPTLSMTFSGRVIMSNIHILIQMQRVCNEAGNARVIGTCQFGIDFRATTGLVAPLIVELGAAVGQITKQRFARENIWKMIVTALLIHVG
jgi:hypothetical protein